MEEWNHALLSVEALLSRNRLLVINNNEISSTTPSDSTYLNRQSHGSTTDQQTTHSQNCDRKSSYNPLTSLIPNLSPSGDIPTISYDFHHRY